MEPSYYMLMIWFFIDIYFYEDYWLLQQDIKCYCHMDCQ